MSDRKDFPHPEPPNKYSPFILTSPKELVLNSLEKRLKKFFFLYYFCSDVDMSL